MRSILAAAVASLVLAGCATETMTPKTAPVVAPKPADAITTASGTFRGDSNHITTGSVEVYRDSTGWKVRLGPDFSLDGAPDPKVALGNGEYVPGTTLGALASLKGEQVYSLSQGLDIGDYTQVWIWCDKAGVPLGHANLTLL